MYLAYHYRVRNQGAGSHVTNYAILQSEEEAHGFLFDEWRNICRYSDINVEQCRLGFMGLIRSVNSQPLWEWEYVRKGNGDLYGCHRLEDTSRFSVDIAKLREDAVVFEWDEDSCFPFRTSKDD